MKRVGIILRDYISESGNILLGIKEDLVAYLKNYPIEVLCIPILFNENEYDEFSRAVELISICDGIILPGGAKEYDIDCKIVKYLYDHNIPTLGLCLGMQLMALAFNGDIEQIRNETHQKKEGYVHEVKIKQGSKLATILQNNKILVNSRHIERITITDLPIVAISSDLIIEAVEDASKKFFIGIQWHPESLKYDIYSKRLFDFFINSL